MRFFQEENESGKHRLLKFETKRKNLLLNVEGLDQRGGNMII